MLRSGKCICSQCFSEFRARDAIYVATPLVRANDHEEEPVIPLTVSHGKAHPQEKRVRVLDSSKIKYENGLPSGGWVTVEVSQKRFRATLSKDNRYCPGCGIGEKPLPTEMGYTDFYFIALAGRVNAGKTNIAGASTSVQVQERLEDLLTGLRVLAPASQRERGRPTGLNTADFIRNLPMRYKGRNIVISFIDDPGEVWNENGNCDLVFQRTFLSFVTDKADALWVVHDESNLINGPTAGGAGDHTSSIRQTAEILLRKKVPVLAILSKIDEGRSVLRSRRLENWDSGPVLTDNSCLLSDGTDIALHMACANELFRYAVKSEVSINQNTPCFVVSAGRMENNNTLDHTMARNVEFPLYYLIKRWNI